MVKFQLSWLCGTIILIFALHKTDALRLNPFSLFSDITKRLDEQSSLLLCIARSCNPLAIKEAFQLNDSAESRLERKFAFPETQAIMAMKLASILDRVTPKFLAIEPNCKDLSYTCPTRENIETLLPPEVNEYTSLLRKIVASTKCINLGNISRVFNLVGKDVGYLENNPDHSGSVFKRILPAVSYMAEELEKLCNKA
ncbi:uncharacterized protein LOC142228863 [Haematobia irritans]|uniref:uncharacterized protein LOC142228863 n=1 Tax=Haematobia irritans TaxID=7368 RepID=UPI003F5045C0